jgi:hypothetical protein
MSDPRDHWDHHDINVRPTPRRGPCGLPPSWWLMLCLSWDALVRRRSNYERARAVMTEGDC